MNQESLHSKIMALSAKQRKLLSLQLSAALSKQNDSGYQGKKIVAYVTSDDNFNIDITKAYLKDKLPDFMVPSSIISIDEVPKLPNGKIDISALPSPQEQTSETTSSFKAPSSENEKILASIWEEVLHFSPISVNDNFFEIGGDSILSIQIIAKARAAGLKLSANQLFEQQTIAELALFAQKQAPVKQFSEVTGTMPLMPIHHWFFDTKTSAPNHWNQAVRFQPAPSVTAQIFEKAISAITEHHDALRLSFPGYGRNRKGQYQDNVHFNAFEKYIIPDQSEAELVSAINQKVSVLQKGLDLENGPLIKACYFDTSLEGQNQIVIIAHHAIIDHVSWKILIDDLEYAIGQLIKDDVISLPGKTDTYQNWSEAITSQANSETIKSELAYWTSQCISVQELPTDIKGEIPFQEADVQSFETSLDAETTQTFLTSANETYKTRPEELITAALVQTFSEWTGNEQIRIGFENHGREALGEKDLSRTIGWFTTYYPSIFQLQHEDDSQLIKATKETMRQVPNKGAGYGMLKYLSLPENEAGNLNLHPPIILNYLGVNSEQRRTYLAKSFWLNEGSRNTSSEWHHLIEVNAFVSKGALKMNWRFGNGFFYQKTIEDLGQSMVSKLGSIIQHCQNADSGNYSPSDFPEADLNQDDLDTLLGQLNI
ncbi:MAG: condensation domain-containing protein [Bacteroidota bacterium]